MKYSYLIMLSVLLHMFGSCTRVAQREELPQRPNILFAIADDASWKHFGAYGCNWVKTPAFDRVAGEGILFTRAYTPNSKCAPSRACILTGRNSWQLEEAANHSPRFPERFKTFAEALAENGYLTGYTAKGWAPGDPGEINGRKRELTGTAYNTHTTSPPATHISNNDYARNFEAFLDARPAGQPFCFWYGSLEPHRGYEYGAGISYGMKQTADIDEVPAFWPDTDTIRTDMLDYAFELEYFDMHLRRMLQMLEERGELENTIVVVTADNGMPFPRIKGQVYEYSNHLPLAVMWQAGIQNPGRTVSDFISFIDFAPTFLDLAGLTAEETGMQPVTGSSFADIFLTGRSGQIKTDRDYVLVGKERHDVGRPDDQGYPVRGIFMDEYLYLRNYEPSRWPAGNPETGYLNCDGSPAKSYILDTRRKKGIMEYWQLNFGKRVPEELYHIKTDPFCMNNLAGDSNFAPVKVLLETSMVEKLTQQGDPRMSGKGYIFDQYPYEGAVQNFYNRVMAGEQVPANWVNKSDFDAYLKE